MPSDGETGDLGDLTNQDVQGIAKAAAQAGLAKMSAHDLWVTGYKESEAKNERQDASPDMADDGPGDTEDQPSFEPQPGLHPLAQVAFPIFQEEGLGVVDGDPEFETLLPFLNDPAPSAAKLARFVMATQAAVEAKRERLADPSKQTRPVSGSATSTSDMWRNAYETSRR